MVLSVCDVTRGSERGTECVSARRVKEREREEICTHTCYVCQYKQTTSLLLLVFCFLVTTAAVDREENVVPDECMMHRCNNDSNKSLP